MAVTASSGEAKAQHEELYGGHFEMKLDSGVYKQDRIQYIDLTSLTVDAA